MKKFCFAMTMAALLPLSSVCVNAVAGIIPLEVGYTDPTNGQTNPQKSPVQPPYVWQEGNTFTFDDSCLGCELRLVDENDNVVYTTIITSNTLVLPSYLSGDYEIQIIRGNWCFYGYICL